MKISRVWAMPSPQTFSVKPIKELVEKYLVQIGGVSIDPFARDTTYATHRNDMNSKCSAEYQMDAYEFLLHMEDKGIVADLILFDPPYSPRQAADCYAAAGVDPKTLDAVRKRKGNVWQRTKSWSEEKSVISRIQKPGGVVISFGWDSNGIGKKRGYEIEEILLICHGACHNDTICMVERKTLVARPND